MRFTTTINNVRCLEWGIKSNLGALVDLINQASSWAKATVLDGVTFYWVEPSKVCEELPVDFSKVDTVYRHYKTLKEKGIIDYVKLDGKYYVRLTEKGCLWNQYDSSEKNPSVGKMLSEARKNFRENSEKNPTDNINNNKYIQDQTPPTPALAVLDYFNEAREKLSTELGERKPSGFKLTRQTESAIKARLTEYRVEDCQRVVDYLVAKWGRDEKMAEYLRPSTLFSAKNFAEYVPMSEQWENRGRPICVAGKWLPVSGGTPLNNLPTVDEICQVYQRYLANPNLFQRTDFSNKHKLLVYHCVIGLRNKQPLERDIKHLANALLRENVEKLASLPVPQFAQGEA